MNARAYLTIDPDDDFDQNATYEVTTQEADLFVAFHAWLLREHPSEIMVPYRFSEKPIGEPKPFKTLLQILASKI